LEPLFKEKNGEFVLAEVSLDNPDVVFGKLIAID
jgi:hypothetical protein